MNGQRIDARGKSREELAALLQGVRRDRLYDLIFDLANIEQHYTPLELAQARRLTQRVIVAKCKSGEIPGTHKPMGNGWRISRRGLEQWDGDKCVTPLRG